MSASCSSSAEIKKYLQALGIKLDLRLTAAWVAIVFELRNRIKDIKKKLEVVEQLQLKPGDRVIWDKAPAYIYSCWGGWMAIWKIENGLALLEGWAGDPIPGA